MQVPKRRSGSFYYQERVPTGIRLLSQVDWTNVVGPLQCETSRDLRFIQKEMCHWQGQDAKLAIDLLVDESTVTDHSVLILYLNSEVK